MPSNSKGMILGQELTFLLGMILGMLLGMIKRKGSGGEEGRRERGNKKGRKEKGTEEERETDKPCAWETAISDLT